MINPGFSSFFTVHRSLLASQMALNTVNHNISNANTPGYSRQRVNLETYFPYTQPNLYQDISSGQLGQGVFVDSVTRIRDEFLDTQYRFESSIYGYNQNYRDALQLVEGILVEPSNSGINASIQSFFDAAQELSINPESLPVRSDFMQLAVDMLNVFQQQGTQLVELQRNLVGDPAIAGSIGVSQLAINANDANNKLEEIAQVNREILSVLASGAEPNDLYDRRDLLLDELSEIVDFTVQDSSNGQINIFVAGYEMVHGSQVLNNISVIANPAGPPASDTEPALVVVNDPSNPDPLIPGYSDIINGSVPGNTVQHGILKGLVDVAGRSTTQMTVRGMLEELDQLLTQVVTDINNLQLGGRDIYGNVPLATDPIFQPNPPAPGVLNIFNYSVDAEVLNDPGLIAAASGPPQPWLGEGDGGNALAMAQLRDASHAGLGGAGYIEFFNGTISNLGIDTRTYESRSTNQSELVEALDLRRESIMGVNTDEEMIDMIRFQRAFEASSRAMQVFDEVVQTIIGMV